ncbi:MAG: flagellar motor switch protein FliM, partial [Armatimonadota bacterium]
EGVVVVSPSIDSIETSSQFVSVAPPNDIVLAILFEVKMGETRHAMSICIPYLVIKPITAKLSAQKWFANSNRKHSANTRRLLVQNLAGTTVECTVLLGKAKLDIREFGELKPGDILRLERRTDDDLELLVGDIPKYGGRPVMSGKRVLFSITEPISQ